MFQEPEVPSFRHDDVEIAFLDEGEGEPIVLVHGFASNAAVNWVQPGWVDVPQGRRPPRHRARQSRPRRLQQAIRSGRLSQRPDGGRRAALLDHLDLGRADVMGYSMGARITAFLALRHPQRLRSAVFGGLGIHLIDGIGVPDDVAQALEAPSLAAVSEPAARLFRAFAEQTKSDLRALAACIRGSRQTLTRAEIAEIRAPALVAVGSKDAIGGSAQALADLLPAGQALEITGRDHMTAVGDKVFKQGVLGFLAARP